MPPDSRQRSGRLIEGVVFQLDELVTDYLNMLGHADKAKGEQTIKDTVAAHPVLKRLFNL